MTIKELIYELEKLGGQIGFDKEVWIANNYSTEPLDNISKCIDLDTEIVHAQLSSKYKLRWEK